MMGSNQAGNEAGVGILSKEGTAGRKPIFLRRLTVSRSLRGYQNLPLAYPWHGALNSARRQATDGLGDFTLHKRVNARISRGNMMRVWLDESGSRSAPSLRCQCKYRASSTPAVHPLYLKKLYLPTSGGHPVYLLPDYSSVFRIYLVDMVWSKITRVFSFGTQWGDNAVRLIEGDNALATVKRVQGILEDSMKVLESHEKVMSSGEFNTFSIKHRHLVLRVVEIKHEVQQHQQQSIISANTAGRGYDRIARDVIRLQDQVEVYHRDVMTASHRAQFHEEESFIKRHLEISATATEAGPTTLFSQPSLLTSPLQSPSPTTTWYSVISQKASEGIVIRVVRLSHR
ncbi:hypothetical protein AG1IA_00827 [Rhizoctonia solani AG-1 IA]|uniref:Uncharacterized protein n=1 Tax=Thanatephorus cucumeris (strain AG1-IA) TaxID=983506 RepID=L8X7U2_THACA|nr:hypothetical protein AG1IA_00827 [Rhizoctonia solani AG-1 IA]